MIDISPTQIMALWEQLFHCVYGDNSYAGNVAEIYLYTVMARDPSLEMHRDSERSTQAFAAANQQLYDLCRLFEQRNGVTLSLFEGSDGPMPLTALISEPDNPWTYRVHIGVVP